MTFVWRRYVQERRSRVTDNVRGKFVLELSVSDST